MNRTLRNALATTVVGGAAFALPALALGAATGSGASFPATAYTKWCQESGLCSYTSKGSTGGINDLINGVVDFAASDAPLTPQQAADLASKRGGATPLYFPTLIGPITVVTHIDGVSKGINFDGKTLGDIFRGAITNWSDSRIRKPNPGVKFPNAPITLCVRSDGSGTSFNFTSYLSKVNPSFRASVGASQQPTWPTSGVVKGARNPGVAACVKANSNSVGYVDIADARDAGLDRRVRAHRQDRDGQEERQAGEGREVHPPEPGIGLEGRQPEDAQAGSDGEPHGQPGPRRLPHHHHHLDPRLLELRGGRQVLGLARLGEEGPPVRLRLRPPRTGWPSLRFSKLPAPLLNAGKAQIAKIK